MNDIIAARPNLNKTGYITIHEVGKRGGVKYNKASYHTNNAILLYNAHININKNEQNKIQSGENKRPMASIVGKMIAKLDMSDYSKELKKRKWKFASYNPRDKIPAFRTESGIVLNDMKYALLCYKTLHVK